MDDFLHNLRSGKLKQVDRANRPYNDPQFKSGQRRNLDRRKGHYDNKESSERLNAIKDVLETLADTQKRMAEAYEARTRAEERKARAMEVLAGQLYRMLNPNASDGDDLFADGPGTPQQAPANQPAAPILADTMAAALEAVSENVDPAAEEESASPDDPEDEADKYAMAPAEDVPAETSGRLTEVDRQTLFRVIGQMRDEGTGWEKIARHIASKGYPTVSGKGNWRGIMVKSLFEKMAAAS